MAHGTAVADPDVAREQRLAEVLHAAAAHQIRYTPTGPQLHGDDVSHEIAALVEELGFLTDGLDPEMTDAGWDFWFAHLHTVPAAAEFLTAVAAMPTDVFAEDWHLPHGVAAGAQAEIRLLLAEVAA